MSEERQQQYLSLIDRLILCPNGQEPDVLNSALELIDEGFVKTLMQVATMMAHQDNHDGAKFLIFLARQLSKELGLYPEATAEK